MAALQASELKCSRTACTLRFLNRRDALPLNPDLRFFETTSSLFIRGLLFAVRVDFLLK